jgi:hypothetical protein
MFDAVLRDFRQPEYLHVLLNPIPIYALAAGLIGLIVAILTRSRRAQIATFVIILVAGASAWPVYELGQQAYDRVLSMADEDGQAWLDEHEHRADQVIWCFYALAILTAVAIAVPIKWPRSSTAFAIVVLIAGTAILGAGGYIAYAGGKIRHREFRNVPPPKKPPAE